MKKYWLLLKNQIGLITNYRVDLFGRWIISFFEITVYYSLWQLTSAGNQVESQRLLVYFILAYAIFENAQTSLVARLMSKEILTGDAAKYFSKPINFPLTTVIKSTTTVVGRILIPCFALIFGGIFFPNILAPISLTNSLLFILFGLLGLIFWNQIMVLIGTVSFWGTEIDSLTTTVDLTTNLAKGSYIPAYLFPASIKQIFRLTPLNYLIAFPIEIYQNPISFKAVLTNLATITFWIGILGLINSWFYKKGLKHYQIFGG
jgi:ABC-2 type transport system permease protein